MTLVPYERFVQVGKRRALVRARTHVYGVAGPDDEVLPVEDDAAEGDTARDSECGTEQDPSPTADDDLM